MHEESPGAVRRVPRQLSFLLSGVILQAAKRLESSNSWPHGNAISVQSGAGPLLGCCRRILAPPLWGGAAATRRCTMPTAPLHMIPYTPQQGGCVWLLAGWVCRPGQVSDARTHGSCSPSHVARGCCTPRAAHCLVLIRSTHCGLHCRLINDWWRVAGIHVKGIYIKPQRWIVCA